MGERLHQLVADDHAAERRVPGGDALGEGDDVRLVVVPGRAEVVAEPPERADHLVRYQQHAVLVADLPHPLEVPGRRREAAAGVLHRLEEDRRDRLGVLAQDRPLDLIGRPEAELLFRPLGREVGRAVDVRVRHPDAAGRQRLEVVLDRGQAGDRERAHRRAVVGVLAAEHLVPGRLADALEVRLGQLPGRLDGLGARGGEEHLVQVARGELGQPRGELDRRRVRVGPEREVGQLGRLLGGGLGQLGAAVPDHRDEQARQAVEVPLALVVVDVRAGAAHDHRDVGVVVGRHPGEVHPQVLLGGFLQLFGSEGHRVPHV